MRRWPRPRLVYLSGVRGQEPKWLGRCPECRPGTRWSRSRRAETRPAWGTSGGRAAGDALRGPPRRRGPAAHRHRRAGSRARRRRGAGLAGAARRRPGHRQVDAAARRARRAGRARARCSTSSGEESPAADQDARRAARRAGAAAAPASPRPTPSKVLAAAESLQPAALAVDSIQTMFLPELGSAPGQHRPGARGGRAAAWRYAKRTGVPTFLVGHVTKDGAIAGPRVLEHMVDTVLYFEGERGHPYRILRAHKNRFGSTNEIGVFEMKGQRAGRGGRPLGAVPGRAARGREPARWSPPALSGTRPLLVEVQALVAPTGYGTAAPHGHRRGRQPRGAAGGGAGEEGRRPAGGLRHLRERRRRHASSTSRRRTWRWCAALVSLVCANRAVDPDTLVLGEVGLAGEVRAVAPGRAAAGRGARRWASSGPSCPRGAPGGWSGGWSCSRWRRSARRWRRSSTTPGATRLIRARPTPYNRRMPAPARPTTSPDGAEKRKSPRAELHILVQFRFDTFEDFLAEYSMDISVGGMFLRTDTPRPEGSMIYLQFALRDGSKLIEGLGKVVRVNPPGGERPAGMGVEFVNLDEDSRGLDRGDRLAEAGPPQQPSRPTWRRPRVAGHRAALPVAGGAGARRHGRGLRGRGGRAQGAGRAPRRVAIKTLLPDVAARCGDAQPLPRRGPALGAAGPPQHRADARLRRGRGAALRGLRAARRRGSGRVPGPAHRPGRASPVEVALAVAIEACAGLEHAHTLREGRPAAAGGAPRPLALEPVRLPAMARSKVLDFGAAWGRDRITRTATGMIIGKLEYMSPEQVKGEPVDARTDVFALGPVPARVADAEAALRHSRRARDWCGASSTPTCRRWSWRGPGLPPALYDAGAQARSPRTTRNASARRGSWRSRCARSSQAQTREPRRGPAAALLHRCFGPERAERREARLRELRALPPPQARSRSPGRRPR